MLLRVATLACHVVVIAALLAATLAPPTAARAALALALVAPLLLTLRGLARGARTTQQWLAVLLVAYIGGASAEVVARAGAALLVTVTLLAAVAELGLLLALIRRGHPRARGARE